MDDERREGAPEDPILQLGRNPVSGGPRDGSTNHDLYLYGDPHGDLLPAEVERRMDDIPEEEWLGAAASNPAFAFLDEPEEDVYGPKDGELYREEPGSPEE